MTPIITPVTLRSDVVVKYVRGSVGDETVVESARVSTIGYNVSDDPADAAGLINYLMRERHGSPFEHNSLTFYVKAPIFVFREWHRHRIASYNERSGRYSKLLPEFYVPSVTRPLVNGGKPSKPELVPGTKEQYETVIAEAFNSYQTSWNAYEKILASGADENGKGGVASEVARIVLGVGIYSEMYVTMNARALMNFLSLRVQDEDAVHVSRPQKEIEYGARQLEEAFEEHFPITYAAFIKSGRVAP
jgi:thymidylate synthase (FAD)